MKALFIILACAGCMLHGNAQNSLPTAGPSFSPKDTTKAEAISVASLQVYPTGLEREGKYESDTLANLQTATQIQTHRNDTNIVSSASHVQTVAQTQTDPGPIRDWSNPPGYMGYAKTGVKTSKRSPLSVKKYQRIKTYRCYTF